jgi:hypothetical protein
MATIELHERANAVACPPVLADDNDGDITTYGEGKQTRTAGPPNFVSRWS